MAAPTRRDLLGSAGIVAAIAASPALAMLPTVSTFDRRLAEWKSAFARYFATCEQDDPADEIVDAQGRVASQAYHALLAEPAPDARGLVEKLNALTLWSDGCVIEESEVNALGAEAAALLKGGR